MVHRKVRLSLASRPPIGRRWRRRIAPAVTWRPATSSCTSSTGSGTTSRPSASKRPRTGRLPAVQVSPPQEHSITPSHDWSERYQPVSYSIARSRSGTGAEFADMVNRCKAVGVGVIVDAVINHMTNFPSPGVGSNGTSYTKYDYPGLYTQADFHPPCDVNNYQSAANVQDCELLSLPDLNTGLASVRQKIADYLIMLARLGVAGFRIDAAKHIQQVDLDDILAIVDSTLSAEGRPVPVLLPRGEERPGRSAGPARLLRRGLRSGGAADITEFTFVGVGDKFRGIGGQHIAQLNPDGPPGNQFSALGVGAHAVRQGGGLSAEPRHPAQCGLSYETATSSASPTCGCSPSRTGIRPSCRASPSLSDGQLHGPALRRRR